MKTYTLGSKLSPETQRDCLNQFVHRFTRDNRPAWARKEWKDGKPYPVQYASDSDWLAHTRFAVTKAGKLHRGVHHCEGSPTWPDNPEMRTNNT